MKFQTVTTLNRLFMPVFGPIEGHMQDWEMYVSSGMYHMLEEKLIIGDVQYLSMETVDKVVENSLKRHSLVRH